MIITVAFASTDWTLSQLYIHFFFYQFEISGILNDNFGNNISDMKLTVIHPLSMWRIVAALRIL